MYLFSCSFLGLVHCGCEWMTYSYQFHFIVSEIYHLCCEISFPFTSFRNLFCVFLSDSIDLIGERDLSVGALSS